MAQHYILDGYNVLYNVPALAKFLDRDSKSARDELKIQVELYCRASESTVTIVYDSKSMPDQFDEYEDGAQPLVVYTGARHSADEYIIGRAEDAGSRSTTIVSLDNTVRESAARAGCSLMEPQEFFAFIRKQNSGKPGRTPSKYREDSLDQQEVRHWLSLFQSGKGE